MTPPGPAPALLRIYSTIADLLAPLAYRRVAAKLTRLGTKPDRLKERRGEATEPRPDGRLIWFHAASVGESLSVLPLIKHMGEAHPEFSFLITSGTATSADILSSRLPACTQHQFAPLDSRRYIRRFLDHWRPDAAIFVESELWPNMLRETRASGATVALINARISDRSIRNWKRFEKSARYLLQLFRMVHCQDSRTEAHLKDLGLSEAKRGVNLKSLAGALPFDEEARETLAQTIGDRPVWLSASTHAGEDEIALSAHRHVLGAHPDALLILVPRHPERAQKIKTLIADADLTATQRSGGELPHADRPVYLADTLGEMGLWYKLAPLTCLFGSFSRVGGHNPYEPAHAGTALLHGPHYANFTDTYAELDAAAAGLEIESPDDLGPSVAHLLTDASSRDRLAQAGLAFAGAQTDALDHLSQDLFTALKLK